MAKFTSKGGKLLIDGKKVIKGWESYTGMYWFATEKVETRRKGSETGGSMINGKEYDDIIWFGYVQGQYEEWGNFSQKELELMGKMKVWSIPQKNLPWSGRTH